MMKSISSFSVKKLLASRRFLLAVGVGVLLLAGAYVWWSVASWNNYNDRSAAVETESTTKLRAALDMKTDDKDQRAAKLAALSGAIMAFPSDESLCEANGLIGWQRVIGDLKNRENTCKEKIGRLVAIRHTLDKTTSYLEAEHALAKILAVAPTGGELAEGNWGQQKDAWAALQKNIEASKSTNDFDSVKLSAKDAVAAIVAAWNEVLAAHQAKDKNKYMKVSTTLLGAYEGLKGISQKDTDRLRSLLLDVEKAYAELPRT